MRNQKPVENETLSGENDKIKNLAIKPWIKLKLFLRKLYRQMIFDSKANFKWNIVDRQLNISWTPKIIHFHKTSQNTPIKSVSKQR